MTQIPYNEHHFKTLTQALESHASETPGKIAFRYLQDGEKELSRLSYSELHHAAQRVAHALLEHTSKGDRAMLFYPQGLDFVVALFGCFLAGVIAVPVYPPIGRRRTERMRKVVLDCTPVIALSTSQMAMDCKKWLEEEKMPVDFPWITTDSLKNDVSGSLPPIEADTIALLQYTSGSTGDPKGVTVTHHNLAHNNHELLKASGYCREVVCWLPIYHDMGLIGNIIYAVYAGATQTLLSPVDFVRKPVRWLQAIADYKATASGGPNFAYDLCVKYIKPEDMEGIDLSHWHATCNGAEPIRAATIARFTEKFAPYGFRQEVFTPCYGMAEATALISGKRDALRTIALSKAALAQGMVETINAAQSEADAQLFCSSGPVADGMRVQVVNPETHEPCSNDVVGEIWVRGHSVTQGYWNQPKATEQFFRARLRNAPSPDDAEAHWLRTGDLGFVQEGYVYITGRLKEIIIINGTNIYPQDVEYSIQRENRWLEENAGAVFGVEAKEGSERMIVFQEVSRQALRDLDTSAIFDDILKRVLSHHDVNVSGIYLISPGRLPKTTSGKIRRLKCAQAYKTQQIDGLIDAWDNSGIPKNHNPL